MRAGFLLTLAIKSRRNWQRLCRGVERYASFKFRFHVRPISPKLVAHSSKLRFSIAWTSRVHLTLERPRLSVPGSPRHRADTIRVPELGITFAVTSGSRVKSRNCEIAQGRAERNLSRGRSLLILRVPLRTECFVAAFNAQIRKFLAILREENIGTSPESRHSSSSIFVEVKSEGLIVEKCSKWRPKGHSSLALPQKKQSKARRT